MKWSSDLIGMLLAIVNLQRGTLGGTQYCQKNCQILKYCVENQQNRVNSFMIGNLKSMCTRNQPQLMWENVRRPQIYWYTGWKVRSWMHQQSHKLSEIVWSFTVLTKDWKYKPLLTDIAYCEIVLHIALTCFRQVSAN